MELGNTEWSYEKVLPFYKQQEHDLFYGETEIHGGAGPVPIYRELEPTPGHPRVLRRVRELGLVEEPDKNGEGEPGYGPRR